MFAVVLVEQLDATTNWLVTASDCVAAVAALGANASTVAPIAATAAHRGGRDDNDMPVLLNSSR
jgi:hypothetical protein